MKCGANQKQLEPEFKLLAFLSVVEKDYGVLIFLFLILRPRLLAGRLPWFAFLTLWLGLAIAISSNSFLTLKLVPKG